MSLIYAFSLAVLYAYFSEKEASKRWYTFITAFTLLEAFFTISIHFIDAELSAKITPAILLVLTINRFLRGEGIKEKPKEKGKEGEDEEK